MAKTKKKNSVKEMGLELTDEQIISGCKETFVCNRTHEEVKTIAKKGVDFLSKNKRTVPTIGPVITPSGILDITSKLFENDSVFMNIILDIEDEELYTEMMLEWCYILGFYLTMKELASKKLMTMPYKKKDFNELLVNTAAFMRYFDDKRNSSNTPDTC